MRGPMYIECSIDRKRYNKYCKHLLMNNLLTIKKRKKPFYDDNNEHINKISTTKVRVHKFLFNCNL